MSDPQTPIQPEKSVDLVPIALREASLDSPTFRASTVHYAEQVDAIATWLDGMVKSASKLVQEGLAFEGLFTAFITSSQPPRDISEAIIDHDYTLLAANRFGEGAREFWSNAASSLKRLDSFVVQPFKNFLNTDVAAIKDARRNLDSQQKNFDNLIARYSSQTKTKEPSSLREDAFQLHEARKLYLKASLDLSVLAPKLRTTLDGLLIRAFCGQWQEMRNNTDGLAAVLSKWGSDMDRVRAWTQELEDTEKTFQRELRDARRRIEESTELATRPSRELDDYSASTVPYLGTRHPTTMAMKSPSTPVGPWVKTEREGWLNFRAFGGKPARSIWVRRWFFVKCGIFSSLVARAGRVEESEKIGVLLCSVRAAFQEERRFCFEVKTKNSTILLQAETQHELSDWLSAFEAAKRKALDDPTSFQDSRQGDSTYHDLAFAITPPISQAFTSSGTESLLKASSEDYTGPCIDRTATLAPLGSESSLARASVEVGSVPKRPTMYERDSDSQRDHTSKIIQKLDLYRKSTVSPLLTAPLSPPPPGPSSGVASLISMSHNNIVSVATGSPPHIHDVEKSASQPRIQNTGTLAPATFVNPPSATNLSRAAVFLSGEHGFGSAQAGGIPGAVLGNLWGTSRFDKVKMLDNVDANSQIPSPTTEQVTMPQAIPQSISQQSRLVSSSVTPSTEIPQEMLLSPDKANIPVRKHRKTISLDKDLDPLPKIKPYPHIRGYPNNYPWQLKLKDAEFHLLFPDARPDERAVLVFRCTWNPNDQQDFPGTVYVTPKAIYFYSNHMGLVLATGLRLRGISEVTAAPGRDSDFLFLHLKTFGDGDRTRVTIKVFLEPLRLLQQRLNWLVRICDAQAQPDIEGIIDSLIAMENEPNRSPSQESWEELDLPIDEHSNQKKKLGRGKDLRATVHVSGGVHRESPGAKSKEHTKFKLPPHPVIFVPQGMDRLAAEKEFNIGPRALFSVLFGDKSAVWQLLYSQCGATNIKQGPWLDIGRGRLKRNFEYTVKIPGPFGQCRKQSVIDWQILESRQDHLLYLISDNKTPWHLPCRKDFILTSKVVITHVAKSKCKLAVYTKVKWFNGSNIFQGLISRQAQDDLASDASDLLSVVADQINKLGRHCSTRKVQNIYGLVGEQTTVSKLTNLTMDGSALPFKLKGFRDHQSLFRLVALSGWVLFHTCLSSLLSWLLGFLRWGWKTANAHYIILVLLFFSSVVNIIYTSNDWSRWRHDRSVGKFLNNIGIGPGLSMRRSITVDDLDFLIGNATNTSFEYSGECSSKFAELLGASSSVGAHDALSNRLRYSRHRLGARRNDLLVALRVVNRIEREVIQSEWESWLLQENARCLQVKEMLVSGDKGKRPLKKESGSQDNYSEVSWETYEPWYRSYCLSCQSEYEVMRSQQRIPLSRI